MRLLLLCLTIACATCGRTHPEEGPRWSSLRDVVTSDTLVGRRILVSGRCVPDTPSGLGRSPDPNSWQLASDGVSLHVLGTRPAACSDTITLTAFVAQDTLPAIGDLPATPRRYLIDLGPVQ